VSHHTAVSHSMYTDTLHVGMHVLNLH